MRFLGQVEIPGVDHPGGASTVIIDESQIEVVVDGDSVGRWSLYDVAISSLAGGTFRLSLGTDQLLFTADQPDSFDSEAVAHVERLASLYIGLPAAKRALVLSRSQEGTKPSRIPELQSRSGTSQSPAVEEPVASELASPIDRMMRLTEHTELEEEPASEPPISESTDAIPVDAPADDSEEAEAVSLNAELADDIAVDPDGDVGGEDVDHQPAAETSGEGEVDQFEEVDLIEPVESPVGESIVTQDATDDSEDPDPPGDSERKFAEQLRAVEEERARLGAALARAEQLEVERAGVHAEAMAALEEERQLVQAANTAEVERKRELDEKEEELARLDKERFARENELQADLDEKRRELEDLEQQRRGELDRLEDQAKSIDLMRIEQTELERISEERLATQRREFEAREERWTEESRRLREELESRTQDLDRREAKLRAREEENRLEVEQLEYHRREIELLSSENSNEAKVESARREAERLERMQVEAARSEYEKKQKGSNGQPVGDGAEGAVEGSAAVAVSDAPVQEVLSTSSDDDPDTAKDLVIDLRGLEEGSESSDVAVDVAAEPSESRPVEKSAAKGGKKSRFGFGSKTHVHSFETAPGIAGMTRNICSECGYISIDSED